MLIVGLFGLLVLAGVAVPAWLTRQQQAAPPPPRALAMVQLPASPPVSPARPTALPNPEPPAVSQVLQKGTLIVISKASQRMEVFKDGVPWDSCQVSTGRHGHATPAGVFPILQKQVFHRSNKYSNAPMPYMQRLTWTGIAIHAGRVPGYAASHGCIRVPYVFARELYALTRASETTVVIANEPIGSQEEARTLALAATPPRARAQQQWAMRRPERPALAAAPRAPYDPAIFGPAPALQARGQTIQLAAAATPADAEAHWARLLGTRPDLARFQKSVVPAVVSGRKVYRLRVSAPDAHATCAALQSAGIACFRVI